MLIGVLGLGCSGGASTEGSPGARASAPAGERAPAPTPAPSAPAPAPAPPPAPPCESPRDCEALVALCPHPDAENSGNCMRPYTEEREHLPGVCDALFCDVDNDAECQAILPHCIGGGTAVFRAYDPPDPEYRVGRCTVVCRGWPSAAP
ncbi:MAG: hypothetical protein IT378_11500 [Sandaracinaceae bacterium]|nr:hypothetical protein [Sandaracinaceae bacterium]